MHTCQVSKGRQESPIWKDFSRCIGPLNFLHGTVCHPSWNNLWFRNYLSIAESENIQYCKILFGNYFYDFPLQFIQQT